MAEEAQMEAMHDQVEAVVTSENSQKLLQTPGVQAALKSVKQGTEFGENVIRMMAQAEVFGNKEVYEGLLQNEATDRDSAQMLTVYRAVAAEVEAQTQAAKPPAA